MLLSELARVIRSKNAGALSLTLDVMFERKKDYTRVITSGAINAQDIAKRYQVAPESIEIIAYPVANAIKITLPREQPSGHPGDGDVYGAQQHAPLLDIEVQ